MKSNYMEGTKFTSKINFLEKSLIKNHIKNQKFTHYFFGWLNSCNEI